MTTTPQLNRPEPISLVDPILTENKPLLYNRRRDPNLALTALFDGEYVILNDFFSTGLSLLSELKKELLIKFPDTSFQGQREFRSAYQELSNRILLETKQNVLNIKKAPDIGWLKILYPEIQNFYISFPQAQGLNSAWQWYKKGIDIGVLGHKIFPYYGTYFPTRFEHLELFATWLSKYPGAKESAIDMGIGSGILSYQLLKARFQNVTGVDSNPNAIIGIQNALKKGKKYQKLNLVYGDLFENCQEQAELIVFNPPWLPGKHGITNLDNAIYYNDTLFENFFEQAKKNLKPDGKLVFIFSNLAQITDVCKTNPIEEEIKSGTRFKKSELLTRSVKKASKKTKRDQNWRDLEKVELWVLEHA
ncbi:class I SAM-dependent methyltransferase [Fibrobacterales bacterium]|nr:class I SAM-dependent methyltransferase [Fibrobacterales bacterium]